MDLKKILDIKQPEKPTALLSRLQKFLPEIAIANTNLNNTGECDIEIMAVEDENDASSSSCSSTDLDDESETKTKKPEIVMDITTLKEDPPSCVVTSDSDSDLDDDEKQQTLPTGFRTKEPVRKKKRKHLIEEVEGCVTDRNINDNQDFLAKSKKLILN
ncbi:hypothetical protein DINM_003171 [Dirofilaria immitis]|nr:hypothetical protein [Dirofilaria immitis]